MNQGSAQDLYRWLDRGFWLIWLAFPLVIAFYIWNSLDLPDRLAKIDPKMRACLDLLPQLARFSTLGKLLYWSKFSVEFLVYAVLLFLAHRVIHRCATGRVLVREMIGSLNVIGLVIALWPVVDLATTNALIATLAALGDLPIYTPALGLDVTVVGVGLLMLMLTIAGAIRQAVALRQDSDLTI